MDEKLENSQMYTPQVDLFNTYNLLIMTMRPTLMHNVLSFLSLPCTSWIVHCSTEYLSAVELH